MSLPHTELDIPPPLTIRQVSRLKPMILQALQDHASVSLRLPSGAPVDLSFVQLVEAGRLYAARHGRSLSLSGPATGDLLTLIESVGLAPETQQFWLCHGERT